MLSLQNMTKGREIWSESIAYFLVTFAMSTVIYWPPCWCGIHYLNVLNWCRVSSQLQTFLTWLTNGTVIVTVTLTITSFLALTDRELHRAPGNNCTILILDKGLHPRLGSWDKDGLTMVYLVQTFMGALYTQLASVTIDRQRSV